VLVIVLGSMEDAASAEKRSAEEFRVRVHGGPHPLRAGSEGAATTSGRNRDDAEQWALQPEPPVDPNASRRIVAHFDVDAFYSQVEELRDPRLVDRPMAVTQKYLIVTCNYPARSAGLSKLMSTQKAKALCPEVVLVSGEDLTPYRACAKKVRAALSRFGTCEKLGLDECWVDLTAEVERRIAGGGPASDPALAGHRHSCTSRVESNNKHRPQDIRAVRDDVRVSTVVSADVVEEDPVQERRLRVGAAVAAEAREAVRAASGLRMSAGVAHNKTLAKLISGLHKPDDQTVLPASHAARVVEPLPVRALPGVGHGVEKELASRGVSIASDLRRVPRGDVCEWLGARVGGKVHDAAWGVDREEVREKPAPSSVTCEDSFRSCTSWDSVDKVLRVIAPDLVARMDEEHEDEVERSIAQGAIVPNGRDARTLTVRWRDRGGIETKWARSSSSTAMPKDATDRRLDTVRRADAVRSAATSVLRSELKRGFDLRLLNVGATNFRLSVAGGAAVGSTAAATEVVSAAAAMNARRDYDRGGGRVSKTEERAASERERGLNGDGLGGDGLNADRDDLFAEPALQDADEDEEDGAAFYADLADVQRSSAVASTETKVAMVGYVPRKRGAEQASLLSFFKGPSKR
jgi:nucleotidyltransferase/DNA polymerase involved in DNA repair